MASRSAPRHAARRQRAAAGFAVFVWVMTGLLPAKAGKAAERVRVLDVMRVRADGPAGSAVLTLTLPSAPETVACDVLVVGASTGGVAAALAAAQHGRHTCLTEETRWIGGQMTAQGVSAMDGNPYLETTGATASFERLLEGIRDDYRQRYPLSSRGKAEKFFNPGDCWVSTLCFEAPVALRVLRSMLQPFEAQGRLRIDLRTKAVRVQSDGSRISSVLTYGFESRRWTRFRAQYVVDATDTGELLPLAGVEYQVGAEARRQTGERHARQGSGDPTDIQSFTYTFVLARDPGHDHRLPKPAEYEQHRRQQPYTMTVNYGRGRFLTYGVFQKTPGTPGSFWVYRRLIAAANFAGPNAPREVSMINWPGNDTCDARLLSNDADTQARALREAKLTAQGFLYWLQNDVPRDGGNGYGYPGLELVTSALGSVDGLSQFPYIRESRRIRALTTITESEISSLDRPGPRAAAFRDSVGIGFYPIDIHSCAQYDFASGTKPFQIPLGALIPRRVENLLAGSKNIGTTHLTNGAYRVHPVEWAIGEAAGTVAAFALDRGVTPAAVDRSQALTRQLQSDLLAHGVPLYWFDDLTARDPAYRAAQSLAVEGIFGPNSRNLHFEPAASVARWEVVLALARILGLPVSAPVENSSRLTAGQSKRLLWLAGELIRRGYWPARLAGSSALRGSLRWSDLRPAAREFRLDAPQAPGGPHPPTRAEFALWLERAIEGSESASR